jgi:hypothetical protein
MAESRLNFTAFELALKTSCALRSYSGPAYVDRLTVVIKELATDGAAAPPGALSRQLLKILCDSARAHTRSPCRQRTVTSSSSFICFKSSAPYHFSWPLAGANDGVFGRFKQKPVAFTFARRPSADLMP